MIETIDVSQFRAKFEQMGRKDQFSYDGLGALFDYLEVFDADYELDVIGLCRDYIESTIEEVRKDYSLSIEDYETDADVIEYLNYHTSVVCENPLIYGSF